MNPGDYITRKGESQVMTVIGGVRDNLTREYTWVSCLWFDAAGKHQQAINVEFVEPATTEPTAELTAYVAKRRADAIAECEPPTHDNSGRAYTHDERSSMRAYAMDRRLWK
jgi:hypothetical protein